MIYVVDILNQYMRRLEPRFLILQRSIIQSHSVSSSFFFMFSKKTKSLKYIEFSKVFIYL